MDHPHTTLQTQVSQNPTPLEPINQWYPSRKESSSLLSDPHSNAPPSLFINTEVNSCTQLRCSVQHPPGYHQPGQWSTTGAKKIPAAEPPFTQTILRNGSVHLDEYSLDSNSSRRISFTSGIMPPPMSRTSSILSLLNNDSLGTPTDWHCGRPGSQEGLWPPRWSPNSESPWEQARRASIAGLGSRSILRGSIDAAEYEDYIQSMGYVSPERISFGGMDHKSIDWRYGRESVATPSKVGINPRNVPQLNGSRPSTSSSSYRSPQRPFSSSSTGDFDHRFAPQFQSRPSTSGMDYAGSYSHLSITGHRYFPSYPPNTKTPLSVDPSQARHQDAAHALVGLYHSPDDYIPSGPSNVDSQLRAREQQGRAEGTLITPPHQSSSSPETAPAQVLPKNERKIVSHFFGRNKQETKAIPIDLWEVQERTEYQQLAYHSRQKRQRHTLYADKIKTMMCRIDRWWRGARGEDVIFEIRITKNRERLVKQMPEHLPSDYLVTDPQLLVLNAWRLEIEKQGNSVPWFRTTKQCLELVDKLVIIVEDHWQNRNTMNRDAQDQDATKAFHNFDVNCELPEVEFLPQVLTSSAVGKKRKQDLSRGPSCSPAYTAKRVKRSPTGASPASSYNA